MIRCGGTRLDRPGWFYPPTVITDITRDMPIFTEEVFGPVAAVYRVSDIDEAIEVANATTFGLGSKAWTRDPRPPVRRTSQRPSSPLPG